MSGKDINELQSKNKPLNDFTFEIFQFDKSGNDINELHLRNI